MTAAEDTMNCKHRWHPATTWTDVTPSGETVSYITAVYCTKCLMRKDNLW